jgi:hypothetical protein
MNKLPRDFKTKSTSIAHKIKEQFFFLQISLWEILTNYHLKTTSVLLIIKKVCEKQPTNWFVEILEASLLESYENFCPKRTQRKRERK